MTNLIIGESSNLSRSLKNILPNTKIVAAHLLKDNADMLFPFIKTPINIIFNNFQTATLLNDVHNPADYIKRSVMVTANVLQFIVDHPIDVQKIIYTSSSAVYGSNVFCSETDPLNPLSLHASLKIANEKLVSDVCKANNIDYTIARVFNMYGGDDRFSIISKIIRCYRENATLNLINHGNAIRDFIHIEDVCRIYDALLPLRNMPVVNVGTGEGTSVKSLLLFLQLHGIRIKTDNIVRDELKTSTANSTLLLEILGKDFRFGKVEDYLLDTLSIGPR